MPATSAQTLLDEASCFRCYGFSIVQTLRIALLSRTLLALNPEADVTPQGLMDYGACYCVVTLGDRIELAILDQISQNIEPVACTIPITAGDSISFVNTDITEFQFGDLVSLAGPFLCGENPALSVTDFSSLVSVGDFTLNGCTSLPSLSFPLWGAHSGFVRCTGCTSLATVSFPNFVPANGISIRFDACALDIASVDHVLARAVANAGYVTGVVNLTGGTNSPPSAQGTTDKNILIARGVTCTTN